MLLPRTFDMKEALVGSSESSVSLWDFITILLGNSCPRRSWEVLGGSSQVLGSPRISARFYVIGFSLLALSPGHPWSNSASFLDRYLAG